MTIQASLKASPDLAADILAIMNLRSLYGDTIDRIVRVGANPEDEALLQSLFTDDCVLDFGDMLPLQNGWSDIRALFVDWHLANISWMWHNFSSPIIEINGDEAKGRWTLLAMGVYKGTEGTAPPHTYGRYTDQYVRTPTGWRFKHQHFLDETRR